MFDPETFVADCRAATVEPDPAGAVREVVAAAIADPSSIDTALGTTIEQEPKPLFLSDELTVRRVLWPPGLATAPHEHRMWAVVGVYAGEERNSIYQRSSEGLAQLRECVLNPGDVLVLDADGIHAVDNPRRSWTAGLHVYGGDLPHTDRSAWGPDGREVSFQEWRAWYSQLTQAMREVARDHDRVIDDEATYLANRALLASWERERRYLTADEARHIIAEAWHIEA
jgi:predicted metal-dependent enzyme (double-stranded beta helix superfamily)